LNQPHAAALLPRVTEIIEETPDYKIFRTGDDYNGWIVLYNKQDKTLDYAIKILVKNWKWANLKTVTQCVLWRNANSPFIRGLTVRMFFDYLLKKYSAIMSDSLQTIDGRDF